MIDAALRGVAVGLRPLIRACRTERSEPPPGALRRLFVLLGFVPGFAAWMLLRGALLALRRSIDVEASVDLGAPKAPPRRMTCTLPDMIQTYLFLFGVWEPDLTALIRSRLRPGDGYIDVGANVGAFVLAAAERVGAGGRILAIEAAPAIAERLRANLARNGIVPAAEADPRRSADAPSTRIAVVAASDREGVLRLFAGPPKNLGRTTTVASVGAAQGSAEPTAVVPARPLGAIATAEELAGARIIKIDVEGAEPAVLRGLAEILDRLRRDCEIVVELSPHWWPAGEMPLAAVLEPFFAAGFVAYELPNVYWPWRYAWPRCVASPRRLRDELRSINRRVDLVLSRTEAETL
ncbi:MAG TPA: FkbM family methyltransferase [Phycisphaerales bacterium]|nr:FkbM family methyltransferase [Phycisphaerales bacterium]HMP36631.1 FkbM family methyltransferase [Phycisphaerales bacterium]